MLLWYKINCKWRSWPSRYQECEKPGLNFIIANCVFKDTGKAYFCSKYWSLHFKYLSISCQNHQNVKIMAKMIPLQGPVHHPEAQYFSLKFWYLSVPYHISLCLKKINGFLIRENSIFVNNKVKNFKNNSKFKITFDIFMIANWNFLHIFYTGNTTGK